MLFQERNLFEDENDITDDNGNIPTNVDLELGDTMIWPSESRSLSDRHWRRPSGNSENELPTIDVWPTSIDDKINYLGNAEHANISANHQTPHSESSTSEIVSATHYVPSDRSTEIASEAKPPKSSVSTVNKTKALKPSESGKPDSGHVITPVHSQEVCSAIASHCKSTAKEPIDKEIPHQSIALEEKVPHQSIAKEPIEVERKFSITTDCLLRLNAIGASLMKENTFTDIYYDDRLYTLTRSGIWLRRRNSSWEMKVKNNDYQSMTTMFREVSEDHKIIAYLETFFEMTESKRYTDVSELVNDLELVEFATLTTNRMTYSHPECTIDLDLTDFGFQVGEIEVMVSEESRIPAALDTISRIADSLRKLYFYIKTDPATNFHQNYSFLFPVCLNPISNICSVQFEIEYLFLYEKYSTNYFIIS